MSVKEKVSSLFKKIPRLFKKEVYKSRRSTPFLISISFLISFLSSRLWVLLLKAHETNPEGSFSIGKNVVLGGYHIHHIAYGIILISIAAWLSINYWSRQIARLSSVLFGVGLGFIVDELGFIIEGIEPYQADKEVFFVAVVILAAFLSVVYFPSFYKALRRDIKRWKRLIFH